MNVTFKFALGERLQLGYLNAQIVNHNWISVAYGRP